MWSPLPNWRDVRRDWSQKPNQINVIDRNRCDRCMDCYNVCPEPQVLRLPLHGDAEDSQIVLAKDCITCGRCIDVCPENVFTFGSRFEKQVKIKNI